MGFRARNPRILGVEGFGIYLVRRLPPWRLIQSGSGSNSQMRIQTS